VGLAAPTTALKNRFDGETGGAVTGFGLREILTFTDRGDPVAPDEEITTELEEDPTGKDAVAAWT
jgi:hypothetical protein